MRLGATRTSTLAAGLLACCAALAGSGNEALPDAGGTTPSETAETPFWRIAYSPFTYHFSSSPDHHPVHMIGAEWQRPDGFLFGAAYFRNSFGQPAAYAFAGQRIDHWYKDAFLYWSAGVLWGYRGEYAHKVPLNNNGISPGLVGGVGWQFTRQLSAQIDLLGTSALMFQFSFDLR